MTPDPEILDPFTVPDVKASDFIGLTWFALTVKPNSERKVVLALKQLGFDTFLPAETDWRVFRKKPRERLNHPLVPGYVFVGLNPDRGRHLHRAAHVDGVSGVLGWSGEARPLNPAVVCDLLARQAAGEFDRTESKRDAYRPGVRVKVLEGPCKGQFAEIVKVDNDGKANLRIECAYLWKDFRHIDDLELAEINERKAA